jgi:pyruvate/2-oxoglutarate dehydrogenase complex dihydrolipoamide acyltransferase (E2) component
MASVVSVRIPQENVNDDFALVLEWRVQDGELIKIDQPLVEIETSKSTFEIPSPATGLIKIVASAGQEVPVGEVICVVGDSLDAIKSHLQSASDVNTVAVDELSSSSNSDVSKRSDSDSDTIQLPSANPSPQVHATRFSHEALALIRQRGLVETDFMGRGLIKKADVTAILQGSSYPTHDGETLKVVPTASPRGAAGVPIVTQSLPRAKKFEAKLLSWSNRVAIRSSVVTLVSSRNPGKSTKTDPETAELRSAAIVYECGRLLQKYPYFNAFCTDGEAHFYQQINIAYALDAGRGLKTPVLNDVPSISLPELVEKKRQQLVDYLNGELSPESLAGGTFTITDLSGAGVHLFDPLIVESQAAILGIGADFAVPASGGVAYNLILAFDHRLIEGRMAATFVNELKDRLVAYEDSVMATKSIAIPAPEPYCTRCSATLSETRFTNGYLVHVAVSGETGAALICTTCLQGW